MKLFRAILGLVAGVFLVLSAGAHSLLGWKAMRAELERLQAPAELVGGLGAGWIFGGVAMLAFGCIVLTLFTQRLRGAPVSLFPANVIGAAYALYGAGALVANDFEPQFFVFVIPGVLLLLAGHGGRELVD